jgi:hypothetical protein
MTPAAASLLALSADSSITSAAHALSGAGSKQISSSLPITGHATSMLAMQGGIAGHAASAGSRGAGSGGAGGGGTGGGSAGQGSGGGGGRATGVSGIFLSHSTGAVGNSVVASLATQPAFAASGDLALPVLSAPPISSSMVLSANSAFIVPDASLNTNGFVRSNPVATAGGGLTVAVSSLNQPISQAFVIENPEPASIVIFAGLSGLLAVVGLRRRHAADQRQVP